MSVKRDNVELDQIYERMEHLGFQGADIIERQVKNLQLTKVWREGVQKRQSVSGKIECSKTVETQQTGGGKSDQSVSIKVEFLHLGLGKECAGSHFRYDISSQI